MNTEQIANKWLACFTARWHQNPCLNPYHDPLNGHSGRVAILLREFWPDVPFGVYVAAIEHDLPEYLVGDVSALAKQECPELKAALDIAESKAAKELGCELPPLPMSWNIRLAMCDKLDALLFAQLHKRDEMQRDDWIASKARILAAAGEMGIHHEVAAVIKWAS